MNGAYSAPYRATLSDDCLARSRDAAFESVGFSLGRFTTETDIEATTSAAVSAVMRVRAMT